MTTVSTNHVFRVFASFDGENDTLLSAFQIHAFYGTTLPLFLHNDALTGGGATTLAGGWSPVFLLSANALDSFVTIGGSTGFASGNTTSADAGWGAPGLNQVQIPDGANTGVAGWFNSNPANLQGRVTETGRVFLGQFVVPNYGFLCATLQVSYDDGTAGAPLEFGSGIIGCPAPGAVSVAGLALVFCRRRRRESSVVMHFGAIDG